MDIVQRSWKVQRTIEEKTKHLGKGRYGRVLKMAKKPDHDEYVKTLEVTGLGLILIGGLGFLIYWLMIRLPTHF